MDDPTPPPAPGAPPVLSYRGTAPPSIAREEYLLTINIPAPSVARQVVFQTMVLMITGVPGAVLTVIALVTIADNGIFSEAFLYVGLGAILFTSVAIRALRRLIYVAREGGTPFLVRVWPGGIELQAPGKFNTLACALERDQIRSISVHPLQLAVASPTLLIRVIATDGAAYVVDIPWQTSVPIAEIRKQIDEFLKLAPAGRVVPEPTPASA